MPLDLKKRLVLKSISAGMPFPEEQLDRVTELKHLKQLIELLDINCVLDVGANKGQFAAELRGIGFKGFIISFEPIKQEFMQLQANFGHDGSWKGYQMALGRKSGMTKINVIPHLTVMSSLLESTTKWRDVHTEDIEVKRLDDMFHVVAADLNAPRVMLKMDTQGYDLEVFAGAERCLDAISALYSELSVLPLYKGMPHYLDALSTYEQAGFQLFNLSVVSRVKEGGLQEMNCLMKRIEGANRP